MRTTESIPKFARIRVSDGVELPAPNVVRRMQAFYRAAEDFEGEWGRHGGGAINSASEANATLHHVLRGKDTPPCLFRSARVCQRALRRLKKVLFPPALLELDIPIWPSRINCEVV